MNFNRELFSFLVYKLEHLLYRKIVFCTSENKDADQLCGSQLISAIVFAT